MNLVIILLLIFFMLIVGCIIFYNFELLRQFNKIQLEQTENKLEQKENKFEIKKNIRPPTFFRKYKTYYDPHVIFNYPARGFPLNFNRMGILFDENGEPNDPNKILTLYGRQLYRGSSQYEYYTMINMGSEQTKIDIDYKKELYDGDTLHIPELGKLYSVKLDKNKIYYW